MRDDNPHINQSSSKRQRIIIIHAITREVPLCQRINEIPVDDLKLNGDTCHWTPQADGLINCKTLWLSDS